MDSFKSTALPQFLKEKTTFYILLYKENCVVFPFPVLYLEYLPVCSHLERGTVGRAENAAIQNWSHNQNTPLLPCEI